MDDKKSFIRLQMKNNLKALPAEKYEKDSRKITNHLIQSTYWKEADVIALTISQEYEVDTNYIIEQAWREGKCVAVPRTNFRNREMKFYEINHFDELEKGALEIQEPIVEKCAFVSKDKIDLIIVPGLAFTKEGGRLGYGGGFYDRYLPSVKALKISLAFSEQMIDSLPLEKHDVKMTHLITPDGFLI